jgi:hypothetical protein
MRHRWIVAAWFIGWSAIIGDAMAGQSAVSQVQPLASPREIFGSFLGEDDQVQIFNGAGRLVTISLGDASQREWKNSTFGSAQSRVFELPRSGAILRIAMPAMPIKTATAAGAEGSSPGIKMVKYRLAPRARYQIVSAPGGGLALMVHVTKDSAVPATEVP